MVVYLLILGKRPWTGKGIHEEKEEGMSHIVHSDSVSLNLRDLCAHPFPSMVQGELIGLRN